MRLRREVSEACESLPWFYGAAWRHPDKTVYVCYPVPLNFLLAWARRAWHRLRFGPTALSAYEKGWWDGYLVHQHDKPCQQCGFPTDDGRGPCPNCRNPYPNGDCSDGGCSVV